jgi:hypothetical protein
MASLIFQRQPAKNIGTNGNRQDFILGWRRRSAYVQMPESLLDECYESILKIAETQSHDGKRAILALAEMFQDNSGRKSYDSQPSLSQSIRAPDRQRIPLDRLRSRSRSRQAA